MRLLALLSMLLLLSLPARAQTKYAPWTNPDQSSAAANANTGELIKRLDKLIDKAEKDRAADPAFLRDLRNLASSYGSPPSRSRSRTVLSDDFLDGDFTANPAWTVARGRYWVERGWGLRSAVPIQNQGLQQKKKSSRRDTALAILGAVLGQTGGTVSGGGAASGGEPQTAVIYSPAAISNAFAINMEFSSWIKQGQLSGGQFEFGPYQGNDRSSGYRLAYNPGEGLTLLSVSPRGRRVIDQTIGPMTLEDKKTHTLRWTRDSGGRMKISIDGRRILSTTDSGFGDSFQGLKIVNRGGDYIVKQITVDDLK